MQCKAELTGSHVVLHEYSSSASTYRTSKACLSQAVHWHPWPFLTYSNGYECKDEDPQLKINMLYLSGALLFLNGAIHDLPRLRIWLVLWILVLISTGRRKGLDISDIALNLCTDYCCTASWCYSFFYREWTGGSWVSSYFFSGKVLPYFITSDSWGGDLSFWARLSLFSNELIFCHIYSNIILCFSASKGAELGGDPPIVGHTRFHDRLLVRAPRAAWLTYSP